MSAKRRSARRSARRKSRADPKACERALEVLSRMRSDGLSLTHAAQIARTTPTTVLKYVPRALVQAPSGRWAATASDQYTRHVWFHTPDGKVEVAVRGSRPAAWIARYMAAVDRYLKTGDGSALAKFRGKGIRSRGKTYFFLTDTKKLDRLAHAGEVSFERLYTRRA